MRVEIINLFFSWRDWEKRETPASPLPFRLSPSLTGCQGNEKSCFLLVKWSSAFNSHSIVHRAVVRFAPVIFFNEHDRTKCGFVF